MLRRPPPVSLRSAVLRRPRCQSSRMCMIGSKANLEGHMRLEVTLTAEANSVSSGDTG